MEKMYDKIVKATLITAAFIAETWYAISAYVDITNENWKALFDDSCTFIMAVIIMRVSLEFYYIVADKIFVNE